MAQQGGAHHQAVQPLRATPPGPVALRRGNDEAYQSLAARAFTPIQMKRTVNSLNLPAEIWKSKNDLYDRAVGEGRKLHEAMLNALRTPKVLTGDWDKRYATSVDKDGRGNLDSAASQKYRDGDFYSTDTWSSNSDEIAYGNFFNLTSGVMIAGSNYAAKDKDVEGTRRVDNTEVLFRQMCLVSQFVTGDPYAAARGLKELYCSSIANTITMDTVYMLGQSIRERSKETEYTPPSDEFYALLYTPNCRRLAFMLKDFPEAFAGRTITGIVVGPNTGYAKVKLN